MSVLLGIARCDFGPGRTRAPLTPTNLGRHNLYYQESPHDTVFSVAGPHEEDNVASEAEIQEEARRVRRLQLVVGLVMNLIGQDDDLPLEEAAELVAATRKYALNLFPDKEETYDMIYQSRFRRLMFEKYRTV